MPRMIGRGVILLALFSVSLLAQRRSEYVGACATTGNQVCTFQVPASNTRNVFLTKMFIQCDAAATVTQDVNGTAATTTLSVGAVTKKSPALTWVPAPTSAVYTAANTGSGTAFGVSLAVTAGAGFPVDLGRWISDSSFSGLMFGSGAGAAQNHNVRVASSGACRISWESEERANY